MVAFFLTAAADNFAGGPGLDILRAEDSRSAVTINLDIGKGFGGWAAGDRYGKFRPRSWRP
jgi:hypothetical protein